jgi:hypothetical protein
VVLADVEAQCAEFGAVSGTEAGIAAAGNVEGVSNARRAAAAVAAARNTAGET